MKSDYSGSRRCKSIASARSVNDGSKRSARCMSDSCVKHGRLVSELNARSGRSRRLANAGITRRGSRLHMRRCAGER